MADFKATRRLCDMDVEEFMMHGLDSDVDEEAVKTSEISAAEISQVTSQQTNKKSKSANHKDQLGRLQEKDPEFYKFLKENDRKLLEFNDSDTGSEMEDDHEDDDADDDDNKSNDDAAADDDDDDDDEINRKSSKGVPSKKHKKVSSKLVKEGEESDDDNGDGDLLDQVTKHKKDAKPVTLQMIKNWRTGLEKNAIHSLKQTLQAFRSAVHGALDIEDENSQIKLAFKVEGDTVFNAIVKLCLKHVYPVLFHLVGSTRIKSGKRILPSSHAKWSQVKTPVKHYLLDILQLLRTLAEPSMLCVILRHAQQLTPYYACFPKVARAFIKRSVRMWSSGEEHVRVLAFLGIRNVSTMVPSSLLEFSVKQLYMNFVKNSKFMSPKMKPIITFMQNSLVEVFSLDAHLTYQHAFVYIRQLAIHLRNAIVQEKKDSYQSVYNWQFIHCLHLWCRVVSEVKSNGVLDPLIYPLVQTVMGAIELVPAARFYPLRFHCIRSLNLLSEATDTYIPVAPFLLEILESVEFNKKTKLSTAKPTEFSCILKVSKQQLGTKPYQDAVAEHIFELLSEFFCVHAHSIAFPEVALPAVVRLRKFIKKTNVPKYRRQMKQLIDKIEETSTEVTNRRSKVSFSPKDIDEVERWTAQYRQHPNAIVKFYNTWKSMKPAPDQQGEVGDQNDPSDGQSDEREGESATKRKRKHSGPGNVKDKRKHTTKKLKKSANKNTPENSTAPSASQSNENDDEDIVQDFQFSSDED